MLETKIEELTSAVYMLNNTMKALGESLRAEHANPQMATYVEAAKATQEEVVEKPVEKTISHDEVQGIIMKIMRADRSKKPAITALLAEYGASLLKEVPAEKLGEVCSKLEEIA